MDALKESRISLLGLQFDNVDLKLAAGMILARDGHAPFAYVVTPNADHFARLRRLPELLPIYRRAWLCLLDSQLIAVLAGTLKPTPPRVVTGADLTERLLHRLDRQSETPRVAVIGMKALDFVFLQARYPNIAFMHHLAPMHLLRDRNGFAKACDFAAAARADITFIAVGSPVQELLAHEISRRPGATGTGLCVGAALEFCAGRRQRAPAWMRRAGLEWLHRLSHNPARMAGRYLIDDPPVLLALAMEAARRRHRQG